MSVGDAIRSALDDQASRMPDRLFDLDEGLRDGVYVMRSEASVPTERMADLRLDLTRCGGDPGWYGARWLWRLRIALGRLCGDDLPVRRPQPPQMGSAADWWTIERFGGDSLVLATTAWSVGDAWLGYRAIPAAGPVSSSGRVVQVAVFRPRGVTGFAYWGLLRPVHRWVFRSMVKHRVQRVARSQVEDETGRGEDRLAPQEAKKPDDRTGTIGSDLGDL